MWHFYEKFQQPLILVYIWYQISDFESKLFQKWGINFEENEFIVFIYEESFHYDAEELVYLNEFFIKEIDEEKSLWKYY